MISNLLQVLMVKPYRCTPITLSIQLGAQAEIGVQPLVHDSAATRAV
jgi:hypothetical protein